MSKTDFINKTYFDRYFITRNKMIDKLELGSIDIMTPLGGGALQLPNGLWEPGSLSAHKGHFGAGATAIPFTASLVAGPAITSPLTFNSIGLNNHVGIYTTAPRIAITVQRSLIGRIRVKFIVYS